jgi:hypothetical protein
MTGENDVVAPDQRTEFPDRWAYTWLGEWPGMAVVQPISRAPGPWAAAWAARVARGHDPVAPSVFHQHVADCRDSDAPLYLHIKWDGAGMWLWRCVATGMYYEDHIATPAEVSAARAGR